MKGFDHHDRASWWHANCVRVFMHMHSCSWLLTVVWRSESAQTSAHMYMCTCTHISWHQEVGNNRVAVIISKFAHVFLVFQRQHQNIQYPAVISPSVFATLSGYTKRLYPAANFIWKWAVITCSWPCIGYNRCLFFMVNQITIRSRAVITASTSAVRVCMCSHVHTCVRAPLHACTPLFMCKATVHARTHAAIHAYMKTFWSSWSILVSRADITALAYQAVCTCMCLHMHACMHAGLHACTPLLMCNQPSMYEHMLTCMRSSRVLIIMIDRSETSGYNRFDLRAKLAVITASTSGLMYVHVFTHAYLCACWCACLYTFAYV